MRSAHSGDSPAGKPAKEPTGPLDPAALGADLRHWARMLGFSQIGVADADLATAEPGLLAWLEAGFAGSMDYMRRHGLRRARPAELVPGTVRVVTARMNYLPRDAGPAWVEREWAALADPTRGQVSLYARGRDYHKVLRGKLRALGRWLEAQTPTRWRACVDSAPTMDRELAWRAGLGWFGKNTCLIDSRRGSAFVIGLLVTDLDLPPDAPAQGGCGSCRLCIEACPTGAIVHSEGRWQVDSRTCISYKTIEHRGPVAGLHGWTFGCDVCQAVCPFNQPRASQPLRAPDVDPFGRKPWPSEPVLAAMDEPAWDALTQGTAVRRPGYGGLRRNAQTVLTESREPENSG